MLVRQDGSMLSSGVGRKREWRGRCLYIQSFVLIKQKHVFVKTLFDRFRWIATRNKVDQEGNAAQQLLQLDMYDQQHLAL